MSKNKFKKIPISEFISDKKLSKIMSIIEKSDDVETNYDRIEMLLDDTYEVKDLGTNRLVLIHKKNKYKNLIFKVAGDSHGIEANYREFYNGDLDKRLTFSYSISKNGTFIVQERVKPLTRDLMKKYKKDVREMLTKLSKKLLLVDCKLDNFKNFGIRNNGDICLLDHGDTVPLPNYQGNDIVNVNEESFVSLRCKKPEEMGVSKNNLKACGGKLKYSKNFDYLICEKCGGICTVNDAYREFYGDKSIKNKGHSQLELDSSFDPDEWKAHIQKYCIETMTHTDKYNNKLNNKGESDMKTKIINERNCVQIKGFWLPEPTGDLENYAMLYLSVKMGQMKPQKYIEKLGLNVDEYKVYSCGHKQNSEKNKKIKTENVINEYNFDLLEIRDLLINRVIEIGKYQTYIPYFECANLAPNVNFSDVRNIRAIREVISSDKRTAGCVYDDGGFSIRLSEKYITKYDDQNEDLTEEEEDLIEEAILNNEMDVDREEDDVEDDDISNDHETETMTSGYVVVVDEDKEDEIENYDFVTTSSSDTVDVIDSNELAKEYASNNNTTIVEDDYKDETPKLVFSHEEINENAIEYNGVKCIVINKYAVPVDIIYKYPNSDGYYELRSHKIKSLLKGNGYQPKKYKVTNSESIIDDDNTDTNNILIKKDTSARLYSPGEYDADTEEFTNELNALVNKYAEENPDKIDKFGFIEIPADEIIVECLLKHVDDGEVVPILLEVCDIEESNNNIAISINYQQLCTLYNLISSIKGSVNISCNYMDITIGFLVKDQEKSMSESLRYSESIMNINNANSVKFNAIPLTYINPSSYFNDNLSDTDRKYHVFNSVLEALDDIFTVFYNEYNDNNLPSINYDDNNPIKLDEIDSAKIDVCNSYKHIKKYIFNNCDTILKLYTYLADDEKIFGNLITAALLICELFDITDKLNNSYEELIEYRDEFMTYIKDLINPNDLTDLNYDNSSDISDIDIIDNSVNSYTVDNITNNKEIAIESEEESNNEEDEILNEKVLEAILELTRAVNSNSEIMAKQNELMTLKLNSLDEKLDGITSNITNTDDKKDIINSIKNKINNEDLILLSEKDINKKTIAIDINNQIVCFEMLTLAKKAISNNSSGTLSVTDVSVINL